MVRFPDVGQGDCALLTLDSGEAVLIDALGEVDSGSLRDSAIDSMDPTCGGPDDEDE